MPSHWFHRYSGEPQATLPDTLMDNHSLSELDRQVQLFDATARACRELLSPEALGALARIMARFFDLAGQRGGWVAR